MSAEMSFLAAMILIPFIGTFFALLSKDAPEAPGKNAFNVCVFTVIANLFLIIRIFSYSNSSNPGYILIEQFHWLNTPSIELAFGVDLFSLLIIASLHIMFLICLIGPHREKYYKKSLIVLSLLFLSMMTGLLVSLDIFSFYIFFESLLLPLFMLIGMFGEIKKVPSLFRFFMYNFIGAVFFFVAVIILYNCKDQNIALNSVSLVLEQYKHFEVFVWSAIIVAFLSRIPIWPFHYWISSISSNIKNPLVFMICNLMPLTAIYGFIRFLPPEIPSVVSYFIIFLEIIFIISMFFIALIGLVNKDMQYKLFSYMTSYYILYVLAAFLQKEKIFLSLSFAVSTFLIVSASIISVSRYIEDEQEQKNILYSAGILQNLPRLSFVYGFLVLAALGFPVSSIFLNNFAIFSVLLGSNFWIGVFAFLSLLLVAYMFVQEFYHLKTGSQSENASISDLKAKPFVFMLGVILVFLASFINPIWFFGS